MLKETFKMRKIGKHLVNVSMLSLTMVPVVVSGIQPVFAEERVANAQTEYPTKIENDMTSSNTPDADGTYNSQIKSIELVNVSGNAYRYKVTLRDGYSIPDGGKLRLNSNIAYGSFNLDSEKILNASGLNVGSIKKSESDLGGDQFRSDLKSAKTFASYKTVWDSMTDLTYSPRMVNFDITMNSEFAKSDRNRSIEFVLNRLSSADNLYVGDDLMYTSTSKPKSFYELQNKYFDVGLGIGSKKVKAYRIKAVPSSLYKRSTKLTPFSYTNEVARYATVESIRSVPSTIENRFELLSNFLVDSHKTGFEGQDGTSPALYLKKGDVVKYTLPKGFRMNYRSGLKVGDIANIDITARVNTTSELRDRFTDITDYKDGDFVSEKSTTTKLPVTIMKLNDNELELKINNDFYINPGENVRVGFGLGPSDKYGSGHEDEFVTSVDMVSDLGLLLSNDQLSEFAKSSDNDYQASYDNTGLRISRGADSLYQGSNVKVKYFKNRNIAVGDQTNGVVKVKYVDESGADIPGNPMETIAENKPWYERVTITPKEIKGYKFVKANKDLTLVVGTGENIVTLTYSRNVTYIPDPKYNAGEKVPDPDDPSKIHVGTKPKVVEEELPFKEEVRENPKLPKGTENVIQEGEKGKKTTTTTYTVDPKTGDVTPSEKVTTKDPKNRIIERGTGEDKDGDLIVNYIPDPENEPGKETIVDEGKKPKLDVTGKVKDPGKPKVIKVGTKPKVVEEEIPFKEEVRENPKLPKGTENVIQEGEKGKKTTTITYTLDEKTGKVTSSEKVTTKDPKNRIIERGTGEDKDGDLIVNYIPDPENEPGKQTIVDEGKKPKLDVTGKVKDPGKPKVIKVGTKPKVVEEEIPFKEEVRENPKLPKGSEFVIQEGEKGKKKTTTTYTLDPKTGKVTSEDKVETKDPKNRIIERGTGEDVDGEIVVTYIPDPENDPGKQTIVDEGKKPKLDVTGKVTDPGKPKVIKVGTKPKVVEEEIPFKEEVRENPKLPKGTENVIQEGEKGKKTTTTTYTMDPKTGEVKPTEKVTTKDPKTRIIERGTGENKDGDLVVKYIPDPEDEPGKQTVVDEGKKPKFDVTGKELDPGSPKVIKVGTKPKVVEEEVPFKEEVRENPELPEGERKVVQEGQVGKKTTTTTYTLDEKTGKVKESTIEKVDEPKVQIVEVGTKKPEAPKEEPKVETPKTTEVPKKEEPKVETPTETPKTEEPKVKETPKELPKTSEQAKQRNTAIVALLSVVGLGGLVSYFGLRKRDEK